MLKARHSQHGVTLIELMIGLAIFAILLAFASPSFSEWMQNSQIRNAAEAIQNGLQLARAEAIKRNTRVNLSFTTSVDNSCAISDSGKNWVISLGDPSSDLAAACGTAPSPDNAAAAAPRIIQVHNASAGSSNAVVAASQTIVSFGGMGRPVSIPGTTPNPPVDVVIQVSNPAGGSCLVDGGRMRCLNVLVSTAGQIRMCDPKRPSTDVQGC